MYDNVITARRGTANRQAVIILLALMLDRAGL